MDDPVRGEPTLACRVFRCTESALSEPAEDDPNTWQCCKCDSLEDDDEVMPLEWSGKTTISCPKCGHAMTWTCCGTEEAHE